MVQDAQKQGMSQEQIALMLMQKGVSGEQLMRMKESYMSGNLDINSLPDSKSTNTNRTRKLPVKDESSNKTTQRYIRENETTGADFFKQEDPETTSFFDSISYVMGVPRPKKIEEKTPIFGKDIFNNALLTFEPQLNIATPENYVLGAGDEVVIDIWGAAEDMIRQVISPDGKIIVEKIGPIHLSGLNIKDANARIKNELGEKGYAGIKNGSVSVNLTIGEIRSIQVNVMGEVEMPGTYTLPSLASVFHALYNAGGINDIGSLRSVKVFRNGKTISEFDVYEYIFEGKNTLNMILQDGDVVLVSPYLNLVEVKGKVKRPMIYEMKDSEAMTKLLDYAGGFTGDAYKKGVRIIRKSGREHQVYNVDEEEYNTFQLTDGDLVSVDSVLSRYENKVEVKGAVYREGLYATGDKVNTVKQLIEKADGIRGDAFLNRAVLYREKEDFSLEALAVDMAGILNGTAEDVTLRKNDVLYIPSIFDLQEEFVITIKGAVKYPGTYKYVANMSVEDVVIQSGGLLESASVIKAEVARRIKAPKSTTIGEMRAETFTLTLKDGLIVSGPADFTLQPFDEVYIRHSPGYQAQQDVFVEGEVLFPGEYAIAKKGERLSDMVKKAGGLTPDAYQAGARLLRKRSEEEKKLIKESLEKLKQQESTKDTINIDITEVSDYYPVGIELAEALKKPGSDYDVILKEGDKLIIPEYDGTVRISGAVMYPNTVVFRAKSKSPHYIAQAGGYAQRARKRKVFVIYMNGTVSVAKGRRVDVRPGCEIIVPLKQPRKGFGIAEIMSLATSTTSMAAMVTSIINTTK